MSDIAEEGLDFAIIYLKPPYDPAVLQPGGCGRLRGLLDANESTWAFVAVDLVDRIKN
jgi:hypothetical protein